MLQGALPKSTQTGTLWLQIPHYCAAGRLIPSSTQNHPAHKINLHSLADFFNKVQPGLRYLSKQALNRTFTTSGPKLQRTDTQHRVVSAENPGVWFLALRIVFGLGLCLHHLNESPSSSDTHQKSKLLSNSLLKHRDNRGLVQNWDLDSLSQEQNLSGIALALPHASWPRTPASASTQLDTLSQE